jgi:phytoene/squalene synthetase
MRMRRDGFDVFHKRYALSSLQKVAILLRHWIAG